MTFNDIFKNTETKETIMKIHSNIFCIITKIKYILFKYNIKYTLAHGTLVGQVRNNNLLLWDDDIDFVIESDEMFENKNFLQDCYNIGLSIIITPYELGYSAKYRITDHKYLKETPKLEPILAHRKYPYPDIMADMHDNNYYKSRYINTLDFNNLEKCKLGPMEVTRVKNYMELIKCFIKIDDINNVTITHIHTNMSSKFLLDYLKKDKIPYKLNQKEIEGINNFYNEEYYTYMKKNILEIKNYILNKI